MPRYRARVIGYSLDADLAFLMIDRDDRGRPLVADAVVDVPLVSPSSENARRGAVVFVFGYPAFGDGYLSTSSGNITIVRNGAVRGQRLPEWYLTDAELAPGNSGGLAVNAQGEMIGIPTMVQQEPETGGRFAWILPFGVIRAEVSAGLEIGPLPEDRPAPVPPIEDGGLSPTFGSVRLSARFLPDPYEVAVMAGGRVGSPRSNSGPRFILKQRALVSGGGVDFGYLGGECLGYAAAAPDFRVSWTGTSPKLSFLFKSDERFVDATLIVRLPGGSWVCDDDGSSLLDPIAVVWNPPAGLYDVWVGTHSGVFGDGVLSLTER